MKINTDDDNVFEIDLRVDVVRELMDDISDTDMYDALINILDEAQGPVFGGDRGSTYLVIKITK